MTRTRTEPPERWNWWKVTLAIVLVGAIAWLAMGMLTGCAIGSQNEQTITIIGRPPAERIPD